MVQQVIVRLLDDLAQLDGREIEADHGAVEISLDGHNYQIDLSKENYGALHDTLNPYIKVARRSGKGDTRATTAAPSVYRPGRRVPPTTPSAGEQIQKIIRRWAVDQNIAVPPEGEPLPIDVVARYRRERRLVTRDDSQGGTVTGKTPLFTEANSGNGTNGAAPLALPKNGFGGKTEWLKHQRQFAKRVGLECGDKARVPTAVTEAWIIEYGLPEFA